MKKFIQILTICMFTFVIFAGQVRADGMMYYEDYSDWTLGGEKSQIAYINKVDGRQRMILGINTDDMSEMGKGLWIFPVPSKPEDVKIDVLSETPEIIGEDVIRNVSDKLESGLILNLATQIYPIFPAYWLLGGSSGDIPIESYDGAIMNTIGDSKNADISVFKHINKNGVTSEVITAKNSSAIQSYLKGKGITKELQSSTILNKYINKDYSFIVSWIDFQNSAYSSSNATGIAVDFPTKDLYFPLMLTSAYGEKVVPAEIRVIGYVSPEVFKDIKTYTKTIYFKDNLVIAQNEGIKYLFDTTKDIKNVKYTKIKIEAPSSKYTQDLMIKTNSPIKIVMLEFVSNYYILFAIFTIIAVSFVVSGISGYLLFQNGRSLKGFLHYGLLGFINIFSIVGLIAAILCKNTKNQTLSSSKEYIELKSRKVILKRTIATILLVSSIIPTLVLLLVTVLAGLSSISHHAEIPIWFYISWLGIITICVIIYILLQVNPEEKESLEILSKNGYSKLTVTTRDYKKILFIILFSIVYSVSVVVIYAGLGSIADSVDHDTRGYSPLWMDL